ncbi:CPBP family intramembrane glutamic endopeptidase [Marinobacter caseinilyticus]|uniref:CPBP family intramembrane glutamic endopeptidase n=1 Tax=Marinobacter caseinilyticus TaxID=2692195 RepID=UPI0014086122|nr:type II CAAX endopeptidase family protein [Marinobacter caseinilyticus]
MLTLGSLYSLLLIVFGLTPDARLRYGGAVLAILLAVAVGYNHWDFAGLALSYVVLTLWMCERPGPTWLNWLRYGLWLVASAALVTHSVPGYEGLLIADHVVFKEGSVATSLYLNHDKVLVAWSLLNWLPLFGRSLASPGASSGPATLLILVAGIGAVLLLAVLPGLIEWRPGVPEWALVFAVSNLLNTCVAEELLFRGVLQRCLASRLGQLVALATASVLFGLAHWAGGWAYVALASAAGLLYGLAYLWTGRLVWAVLVHWALNMSHFLLFTYPMSA